ncbi:serine/threonine protein kinase, putative [Entamoeba invadens IP1]|uniref:Aurora kinase n=1 Tax=Entamoeba invadens IP1 TaxID=370355 RepID=L7FN47_ENTIV|nr:serine/threonine protein kinase, putative [Entamoeba invadens IP1]ELP91574.1 serine/threonine protein kinase, putative [Entamoeba invadens IP1]|eukprot:XP_004258345.1 serine/threonine protein kinase, putative [Entamoeba invadens IP1]
MSRILQKARHTMLETVQAFRVTMKPFVPFRAMRFSISRVYVNSGLFRTFQPIVPSKYDLSMFSIGEYLGRGNFGEVYLALFKPKQYVCALKRVRKTQMEDVVYGMNLKREIEIMSHMSHPNIVKMLTFFEDDKYFYIVMEYCKRGELYKLLKEKGRFADDEAAKYVKQTTRALIYVHSMKCIHRDLKPENILLDMSGNVKLADFGLSVRTDRKRETKCGTPEYFCPEIVRGKAYDESLDQWGLGILTFEFLAGYAPLNPAEYWPREKNETAMKIKYPVFISLLGRDFIDKLTKEIPECRMKLEECLEHPWIMKYAKNVAYPHGNCESLRIGIFCVDSLLFFFRKNSNIRFKPYKKRYFQPFFEVVK